MSISADNAKSLKEAARRWIDAWNHRDLEAILEHYADDIEVCSPRVVQRYGIADGRLRGKQRLREYFADGLRMIPDLHMELVEALIGVNTMTVVYRRENGALVADCSELDEQGKIKRMFACYGEPPAAVSRRTQS
jgi:hypothetical protein